MNKMMDPRRFVALTAAALLTAGCLAGVLPKPATPTPAIVIEGRDAEFETTCADVYRTELGREIDRAGAADCLDRCRRGETKEQLVAWVRASDEYKDRQARLERERQQPQPPTPVPAPPPTIHGALRVVDQRIVDGAGEPFLGPGVAPLVLFTKSKEDRAAIYAEAAATRFRIVRAFGGRLNWPDVKQSPAEVLALLPTVLRETREHGLRFVVDALTDTRDGGYDEEAHLSAMRDLTAGAEHVILAVANEPWHPSQSDRVQDMEGLCAMARRVLADYPNLWMLGAGPIDRPVNDRYAGDCGPIWAAHIDRGGTPSEQLARVVGLAQIAMVTGKPGVSLEPIGAAEVTVPGRRLADARFFGELAHLQASYGILGFFHAEDWLFARRPGPVQREAGRAFAEGYARPRAALEVPPAGPCTRSADPDDIVRCQRSTWGRMSESAIATFLRDIARDLNEAGVPGGPFGVLVKPGGTNCKGYSCDIICAGNGPDQDQWDVLGDVEGAQSPGWSKLDRGHIVVRPCEPVSAGEAGPPFPEGSIGRSPAPFAVGMRGRGPR